MPEPEYKMDEFAERIKPDTWTGVDGLGRTLPLYSNIKKGKNDRIVGIFTGLGMVSFQRQVEQEILQR